MQQDTRDENHQHESKRRRRHRRRIRKENAATSKIKDVAMKEAEQRDNETDRMQEGVGIDSDETVAVSKLPLGYFSLLPQSLVDHIMSFAPRETKVLLRGVCNTFRDLFFAVFVRMSQHRHILMDFHFLSLYYDFHQYICIILS